MNEMTFAELKKCLNKTIHFGVMETVLFKKEDGGFKLEVLERDEYDLVDADGNAAGHDGDLTNPFCIFMDHDGVIGVIEHHFGMMTRANKDEQMLILELIDKKVTDISEQDISSAVPFPTPSERQFNELKKKINEIQP